MIDFVRGALAHVETDYVVLDVQGIGYRLFCANSFGMYDKLGSAVTLYVHHVVREDAMLLYGFESREEQALFRRLLDVSGIGPRVALGILSGGRPAEVVSAIRMEDVTFLTRLPGIGKKTAQRMILDLKDKLDSLPISTEAAAALSTGEGHAETSGKFTTAAWREAKDALRTLGYKDAELDRAWPEVREKASDKDGVDKLMKLALQVLFKG
jgi:holliday junction DNA helicase RuvA